MTCFQLIHVHRTRSQAWVRSSCRGTSSTSSPRCASRSSTSARLRTGTTSSPSRTANNSVQVLRLVVQQGYGAWGEASLWVCMGLTNQEPLGRIYTSLAHTRARTRYYLCALWCALSIFLPASFVVCVSCSPTLSFLSFSPHLSSRVTLLHVRVHSRAKYKRALKHHRSITIIDARAV